MDINEIFKDELIFNEERRQFAFTSAKWMKIMMSSYFVGIDTAISTSDITSIKVIKRVYRDE